MKYLKAVLILGPGTKKIHPQTIDSIIGLYLKKNYLIIGDGENFIKMDQFVSSIYAKINQNTRIDIYVHGTMLEKHHMISIFSDAVMSSFFFTILKSISISKPLNVNLWSCFAKNALSDIGHLPEKSVLTTHGGNVSVINPFNALALEKSITNFQNSNFPLSPFKSFIDDLAYSANEAHIITIIEQQTYQFSMTPTTKEILVDPKGFLGLKYQEFVEFYYNQIASKKDYMNSLNLVIPNYTEQEINFFSLGSFIVNCRKNYQIIESGHLLANKTIADKVINEEILSITPLYIASQEGQSEVVQILLNNGAIVDKKSYLGATPLYTAVVNRHLDTVKILLQHGAEIDKMINNSATALTTAVSAGSLDLVELLLKCGADPLNKIDGYNALDLSIFLELDSVTSLLKAVVFGKIQYHQDDCLLPNISAFETGIEINGEINPNIQIN